MSFVNDDDNKRCIIFKYEISLFYYTYLKFNSYTGLGTFILWDQKRNAYSISLHNFS